MVEFNLADAASLEGAVHSAVIKVIGIGNGGVNSVRHMIRSGICDIEFICANTDAQTLQNIPGSTVLHLGANTMKGLGAGLDPELGRKAAVEDQERLKEILKDADMVFVVTGLGGGTGTGAAPVVVELAKELGILTVAVVTTPFTYEGQRKLEVALEGVKKLEGITDSLLVIDNNKVLPKDKELGILAGFAKVDDVLCGALRGISDTIKRPGIINIDFADIRKIMQCQGLAIMAIGSASGSDRAIEAAKKAIDNPLLDDMSLKTAKGVIVNISAGEELGMLEINSIAEYIKSFSSKDALIKFGFAIVPELGDELNVMVIATGLSAEKEKKPNPARLVKTANARARTLDLNYPESVSKFDKKQVPLKNTMAGDYLNVPTWVRDQLD